MQHNQETENLALLYAYGELDGRQEKDFLLHLKECPNCQDIVKITGVITAALPDKQAPSALCTLPAAQAAPKKEAAKTTLWETMQHLFNFRKLVPAGAMVLVLTFMAVTAYKYGTMPNNHDFVDNMYAEITSIESDLDSMFEYFESL